MGRRSHRGGSSSKDQAASVSVFIMMMMAGALLRAETVMGLIECGTVTALVSTCSNFITYGMPEPMPGTPCCNAMLSLNNFAVESIDSRRSVCRCLMALVTTYNPNATAVANLPGLCGISLGFTIDPNTDCTYIP